MLWPWLSIGALLLAASVIALAGRGSDGGERAASVGQEEGALVPEHTVHDFGQIRMGGGPIDARFRMAVQSPVRVTRLETT